MSRRTSAQQHRGLTLVEMMVVVVVMGIIVSVAAPSFGDMLARYRVRGVAAELASSIELARSESLARGNVITFFGGNALMTCYSVVETNGESCDCTKPIGTGRCTGPTEASTEILTVQVMKSTTVTFEPQLAEGQAWTVTTGKKSFKFVRPTYRTDPMLSGIDISSSRSGKLRLVFLPLGRTFTCSPDSSISGAAPCP